MDLINIGSNIKNLDLSGIAHMSIPIIKRYNLIAGEYDLSELKHTILGICDSFTILEEKKDNDIDKMINNYTDSGNIEIIYGSDGYTPQIKILMDNKTAKKEISGYKKVYGNQNYERVKQMLIERV